MNNTRHESAFPESVAFDSDANEMVASTERGMTLRDYFAAKAMAALIVWDEDDDMTADTIAGLAYSHADAMLRHRAL